MDTIFQSPSKFRELSLSQKFVILNTDSVDNIDKFEKSFFDSFVNINNKLIHQIWDWDFSQKKLKTRISYNKQIIYTLIDNDQNILASIAVNMDSNTNQFSEFGFSLPSKTSNYCEVLTLFIHPRSSLSVFQLSDFVNLCTKDSASRGLHQTYATCGKKLLRLYQRIGCDLLDSKVIDREDRYFIRLNY
jgi:hypothetical protein